MKDMLTYRAPRNTNEAFTKTAEYGAAIERTGGGYHRHDVVVMWGAAAAVVALVVISAMGWLV